MKVAAVLNWELGVLELSPIFRREIPITEWHCDSFPTLPVLKVKWYSIFCLVSRLSALNTDGWIMQSTSATKAKGHFWGSGNKIKQITISQSAHLCQAGVKFPRFKVFFIAERDINTLQSYFGEISTGCCWFFSLAQVKHHFWISDTRF